MSGVPVADGGVRDDGGHYMTPWPLSDKYFLVAYSYLKTWPQGHPEYYRAMDEKGYGLYLIDVFGNKELIYRDPEISCFLPTPLQSRPRPPVLPDMTDATKPYAVCTLSEAAYGCEGIEPQQIRYLRISHRIPWPYDRRYGGLRYENVAQRGVELDAAGSAGDSPGGSRRQCAFSRAGRHAGLFPAVGRELHGTAADEVIHQLPAR